VPVPEPVPTRIRVDERTGGNTRPVTDLRGATACELLDDDEVATILGRLGPDPLRARRGAVGSVRKASNAASSGKLQQDQDPPGPGDGAEPVVPRHRCSRRLASPSVEKTARN
jgi:hypothetical protein